MKYIIIAFLFTASALAELPQLPKRAGLWVHVGCGDGSITRTLGSGLILGVDADGRQIAKACAGLQTSEKRLTFAVIRSRRIPLIDNVANIAVVSDPKQVDRAEILRVLCPLGTAYIKDGDAWKTVTKPWPESIDNWTHFLHDADGIPSANDTTVGPPRHMQWQAYPQWDRSHDFVHSLQAAVTKNGRIFYFLDKASGAVARLPGEWMIVARDSFNGTLMWEKKMVSAPLDRVKGTLTPLQFHRLLVAGGRALYTISGRNSGVCALDMDTGKILRRLPGTEGAEEIVCAGDCVAVITGRRDGKPESLLAFKENLDNKKRDKLGHFVNKKCLSVFDEASGRKLWDWSPHDGYYVPVTVAIAADRLVLQKADRLDCFELKTGKRIWQVKVNAPLINTLKTNHFCAALGIRDGIVLTVNDKITALSLKDGKKLWSDKDGRSAGWPVGLFVSGDRVWRSDFSSAWDLKTGRTVVNRGKGWVKDELWTDGHHHRCQPEKATVNYGITTYRGAEFIDLHGDQHCRNNWVRGICQFGLLPSQGLLYAPPHTCGCYPSVKLYGFWALAPERKWKADAGRIENRLQVLASATGKVTPTPGEWPTYRGDIYRSARTRRTVPTRTTGKWETTIGGRLTAPVAARGLVLVANRDNNTLYAVDAKSGKSAWNFTAGGPIDSPPTVQGDLVLFGSADGYVHCLSAKTGKRVWEFFAAPEDYRTVSHDKLESVWPVRGSVLVLNGIAYAVAGRQSYIDGGLYLWGLDPASGKVRVQSRIVTPNHKFGDGKKLKGKVKVEEYGNSVRNWKTYGCEDKSATFIMHGARSDVLTSDGRYLYMGLTRITPRGEAQYDKHSRHLFSTSSLLEESENHRSHYVLGTGDFSLTPTAYPWMANSHYRANKGKGAAVPIGRLIAFDDQTVWTVMRATTTNPRFTYGRGGGPGGYSGVGGDYYLVSMPNKPFNPDEKALPDFREPGGADSKYVLMDFTKVNVTGKKIRVSRASINHWSQPSEYATWKVRIAKPGTYRIGGNFAASHDKSQIAVQINETGQTVTINVKKTESWSEDDALTAYAADPVIFEKAGAYTLVLKSADPTTWNPINVAAFGLVRGAEVPEVSLKKIGSTTAPVNWTKTANIIRPRSMILASNAVVIGGMKTDFPENDPAKNYDGRGERADACLWAYSRNDGSVIAKNKLPSAPVWNGMAAAYGRIYVATVDGRILCLGE